MVFRLNHSSKIYSRFQFGWFVVIALLIVILLITAGYIYQWGNNPIPKLPYFVLLVFFCGALLTFCGMTVTVNEKQIIIKLGIGFYRKKIDLESVKSAEVIIYPPYYGWGIRIIPNGILYNVSGKHAVKLMFKNSKRILLIGTDDWDNLKLAIEQNLKNQIN
jgi:hypothetical protein